MKYQVPASILFLVLCYWSCPLTVSGFTEQQLERVTSYVTKRFSISGQYAYVIKFTSAQCAKLTDADIVAALKEENLNNVQSAINKQAIYHGTQMVMATFKNLGTDDREHSEHRLLYPYPGSNLSPAEELMNKRPTAGCVLFYTFNSPCNAYCTDPNGERNIVRKLDVFKKYNNRAFVFSQVYKKDKCCDKTRMQSVEDKMPLYRCPSNCFKCFEKKGFSTRCLS